MIRQCLTAVSATMLLFMVGCYESRFPLGPPEGGKIDQRLPGYWRCLQKEKAGKPFLMAIIPYDERQYYAMLTPEDEKPAHYRAYSTEVRGTAILNIQEIAPADVSGQRGWVFSRYALLKPDVLQLDIVQDDAFKGVDPSPSPVREVVERNIRNDAFFQNFCTCVRVEQTK